jgi:hypothetical protein
MKSRRNREASLKDVLDKVARKIRLDHIAKKLTDKIIRFFKTKNKRDDLTNQEASLIYRGIDFDTVEPLSKNKLVDIDWTNHAKWRSDLRDVDPDAVNKMIQKKLVEMRQKNPNDRGDVRLKDPGTGTAVILYNDLVEKQKPAKVNVITTWR